MYPVLTLIPRDLRILLENHLKNEEMAIEDDYGMIVEIINNGKIPQGSNRKSRLTSDHLYWKSSKDTVRRKERRLQGRMRPAEEQKGRSEYEQSYIYNTKNAKLQKIGSFTF